MKPPIQSKWPQRKITDDISYFNNPELLENANGWNACHDAFMSIISKQKGALMLLEHKALQEIILPYSKNAFDISQAICSKFEQQRVEIDEKSLREYLWMSHGHTGMYGDDGEMQCAECCKYGCSDYKRNPLNKIIETIIIARRDMNIAKFSLLKPAEQQFKSVDEIYNFLRKEQTEIFTKSKPKTNHLLIYAKAIFDILYGKDKK